MVESQDVDADLLQERDVQNAHENKRDARVDVLRDVLGLKRANEEAVVIVANVAPRAEQGDVKKIDQEEDKF